MRILLPLFAGIVFKDKSVNIPNVDKPAAGLSRRFVFESITAGNRNTFKDYAPQIDSVDFKTHPSEDNVKKKKIFCKSSL